ncbi:kinase-like domain-containing protein [Rhizophagus irregularis DAOM 181602=DAOM 197198]|nr:kinase-like domain-containing protein [Rhizophagus irregularis DAOM 181602=DAOM 197198]
MELDFADCGDLTIGKEIIEGNVINWTSGNEAVDYYIQEKQSGYNGHGAVFGWIPYSELIDIKEIEDNRLTTAILKNGSLYYSKDEKKWIRESHENVVLRFLCGLHESGSTHYFRRKVYTKNITDEFSNKVKPYLLNRIANNHGISQNPDTNVYILVFIDDYLEYYCEKCDNITDTLLNMADKLNFGISQNPDTKVYILLKICKQHDVIFEWISYKELIGINEINKDDGFTAAIWKKGQLSYSIYGKKLVRRSKEVVLRFLYDLQNINEEFLNKVESYLANKLVFGISQNPDTKVYILYLNNNTFLNEITYLVKESYGVTLNPNTNDFILVLQSKYYCENCRKKYNNKFEIDNKSCVSCQTNHENKKINDLIQEIKLSIDHSSSKSNLIFEWIPYDQFDNIKEIGKGGFSTVYSAIWKNGLLLHEYSSWKRKPNTKVALKRLHNSQNFLDEFINEVKAYPRQKINNILKIYGISRYPTTKEYIMVLEYAEDQKFKKKEQQHYKIEEQFKETQDNRKENLSSIKINQLPTHKQAIYTSRLLNPFTKSLSKYDNIDNNTVEIIDFTNL